MPDTLTVLVIDTIKSSEYLRAVGVINYGRELRKLIDVISFHLAMPRFDCKYVNFTGDGYLFLLPSGRGFGPCPVHGCLSKIGR